MGPSHQSVRESKLLNVLPHYLYTIFYLFYYMALIIDVYLLNLVL